MSRGAGARYIVCFQCQAAPCAICHTQYALVGPHSHRIEPGQTLLIVPCVCVCLCLWCRWWSRVAYSIMRCLGASAGVDVVNMLLLGGEKPKGSNAPHILSRQYSRAVNSAYLKVGSGVLGFVRGPAWNLVRKEHLVQLFTPFSGVHARPGVPVCPGTRLKSTLWACGLCEGSLSVDQGGCGKHAATGWGEAKGHESCAESNTAVQPSGRLCVLQGLLRGFARAPALGLALNG